MTPIIYSIAAQKMQRYVMLAVLLSVHSYLGLVRVLSVVAKSRIASVSLAGFQDSNLTLKWSDVILPFSMSCLFKLTTEWRRYLKVKNYSDCVLRRSYSNKLFTSAFVFGVVYNLKQSRSRDSVCVKLPGAIQSVWMILATSLSTLKYALPGGKQSDLKKCDKI